MLVCPIAATAPKTIDAIDKKTIIICHWSIKFTKGIYKKAKIREIKDFTGIDSPYEKPKNPALTLFTDKETADISIDKLYKFIIDKISNSWLV